MQFQISKEKTYHIEKRAAYVILIKNYYVVIALLE